MKVITGLKTISKVYPKNKKNPQKINQKKKLKFQFQRTLIYLTTRNQSTFTQKLTVTTQNDGIRNIMLNNEKTR